MANYGNWWRRATAIAKQVQAAAVATRLEWYCFGRSILVIESDDDGFSRRFREIYGECSVEPSQDENLVRIVFRIENVPSEPDVLAISVRPELPNGVDFLRRLLPELRYVECVEWERGWRMLALEQSPEEPVLAFGPSVILASRSYPWQHPVALYAISSALGAQPDLFVFHAASVGVLGKGVLLSGPKGAGKTTLSLCFASRNHDFLGDEWAMVSSLTGELLPLRRAASIRPGPHPKGLDDYLRHHRCSTEILPDGTERVRASVGVAYPRAQARVVPLTDIFFLRRFALRPAVERFTRRGIALPPVSPLLASIWGHSPGRRALDLLRTLDNARWWHLDVGGSPEETTELVEETIKENLWH
jgi:hypothetical protein